MHDTMQENSLTGEMQDRCISCGRWGWREEVGAYHDAARDGRTFHLCHDCRDWVEEEMGDQIGSDVVSRDKFDGLLWSLAESDGALHLQHVDEVKELGFKPAALDDHYAFPQPLEGIGATFWRWEAESRKLAFCCAEGSFANYVQSLATFEI